MEYSEPVDLIISAPRLLTSQGMTKGTIAIDDTKIVKIGGKANMPKAEEHMDIKSSSLLLPAVLDLHSHLRGMELAHKGDFPSETQSAAAGGITFALDMPNSKPQTLSADSFKQKKESAEGQAAIDFGLNMGVCRNEDHLRSVKENFAYGEIFVGPSTEGSVVGYDELASALSIISQSGKPAYIHAEDPEYLNPELEARDHSLARPPEAEYEAVSKVLSLNLGIGARIHFCHISTKRAILEIARYKEKGMQVTCEVTPHHLTLCSSVYQKMGALAKMNPPLRSAKDSKSMLDGIITGKIDIISSDHAPHSMDEKSLPPAQAPAGVPGFETFIPAVLTHFLENNLDPSVFVRLTNKFPARMLSIPGKGFDVGRDADLVVLDPKRRAVDPDSFLSRARYSPFAGRRLKFWPTMTILRGSVIFEGGDIIIKDRGSFLGFGG